MAMSVLTAISLLTPFLQHYCHAQDVENFSCVFSECAGEDIVCNCSVPNDPLFWWDGNHGFCSITILHDSNPTRAEPDVVAEVVANSPSGGFTSRLTRRNISTELSGTEIGCSQSQIDSTTCRPSSTNQNSSFTLIVQSCQAPNPPRDLNLVTAQDTQCNSIMRTVTLIWMVPEPPLSQFPVTHYSLTCTSGEGNSCSVTLPADTTSYNLPVDAGVRYTITVSALSNGRESQGNPQLNLIASFCNDTTPPTGNETEITTAGTPSTPTSNGIQTTSTPTTDLGSIIGGSIGGFIGALILIISIIIIIMFCYYCSKRHKNQIADRVCWKGHYDVEMKEAELKEEENKRKEVEDGKEET